MLLLAAAYIRHTTFNFGLVSSSVEERLNGNDTETGSLDWGQANRLLGSLPSLKANRRKHKTAEPRKSATQKPQGAAGKGFSEGLVHNKAGDSAPTEERASFNSEPTVATAAVNAGSRREGLASLVNNPEFLLPTSEEELGERWSLQHSKIL